MKMSILNNTICYKIFMIYIFIRRDTLIFILVLQEVYLNEGKFLQVYILNTTNKLDQCELYKVIT